MSESRRIVALNAASNTPEVVLHRTLTKIARIKSVAIIIQWDDNSFDADWSIQKTTELATAALLMTQEAVELLRERQ